MVLSTTVNSTVGHICICIPQYYHPQPIISQLISRYKLTVNIAAAVFAADTGEDGWFNLEIQGSSLQVEAALAYLQTMNVEIEQLNLKSLEGEVIEPPKLLCVNSDCSDCVKSIHQPPDNKQEVELHRTTNRAKFQICIPQNYRYSPVIAGLVSCYGLTVNIAGAFLDINTKNDGWFDLEISGRPQQIIFGLRYLKKLGLQIWL
ncbi:NIL domain-containing protein [Calothrix sp. PCC 7507]|uniref:NIL domain-containing protein n=1 Tax=Calothrix sp. PCC 7507 TaxID=99598 RepID=UPI00029EE598|nr:NIL domain-containing protein [Calothrix sp. PCC 7507]AFY36049.1 NIL domain-containing protein [Calothrix sp. PCC 7507]